MLVITVFAVSRLIEQYNFGGKNTYITLFDKGSIYFPLEL